MHQFFFEHISSDVIAFSEEEAAHAIKVLRLKPGDVCEATDGKGTLARIQIEHVSKRDVSAKVLERNFVPQSGNSLFTLIIAPTKRTERMEWMIEKLVEVGLMRLVLIESSNSERHHLKTDRLFKKAISAMKQSGRVWLPEMISESDFSSAIKNFKSENNGIGYCGTFNKVLPDLSFYKGNSTTIVIGPEGDFTPKEIELSADAGYSVLDLGKARYRTETAALVACTLTNHFCVTLKSPLT
ncbi:MAG: RsmE family RNA methyltransferase [Bacteroidetes bacterium]|nr:RsmE family RNA methyltransferase [Bacteroidota bacterium]